MLIKQKYNIAVALSGGVDSSVAAALLKDMGHNVRGYYYKRGARIRTRYLPNSECPAIEDLEYLEKLKSELNIPIEVFDLSKEYEKYVFNNFLQEYKQGHTPNPDVLCNRYIKFGVLIAKIKEKYNFDFLATGHYARIGRGRPSFPWEVQDKLGIYGAIDINKDQVYFLGQIKKQVLKNVTFPLGNLFKTEVRLLANYYNLPTRKRKESQGICFLGKVSLKEFLLKIFKIQPGNIIDIETGKVVGKHKGVFLYTIGQRKGLDIGGLKFPYYVAKLDFKHNIVYVAKGRDNPKLFSKELQVEDINLLANAGVVSHLYAIVRYRQKYQPVKVKKQGKSVVLKALGKGFWAPAIGQYVNVVSAENSNQFNSRSPFKQVEDILKHIFTPIKTCKYRCYKQVLSGKIVGT